MLAVLWGRTACRCWVTPAHYGDAVNQHVAAPGGRLPHEMHRQHTKREEPTRPTEGACWHQHPPCRSSLPPGLHLLLPGARSVYMSVMSDMSFTSCVLDLSHAMLMAAGGPLWQQFQRTDISTAQR